MRTRIAIDTNVLIGALTKPSGNAARIVRKWRAGEFDVVASKDTLREAEAVLGASWVGRVAGQEEVRGMIKELRKSSVLVDAPRIPDLHLNDTGDRRLVEAAVAGNARYLATADREVLLQRGYGPTEFVRTGELLRALARSTGG